MTTPWLAAIASVFVWWFSTGAILLAVRHADRKGGAAHGWLTFWTFPMAAVGVAMIVASRDDIGHAGAYLGFLGALAVWGWIELALLTGVIAGPERRPCPPGLSGAARFVRAFRTLAHHEIALLSALILIAGLSLGAGITMALQTFALLFLARILAKLNLFFGVPRINVEFIPVRLHHLRSYFRQGPITLAFAVAITVLTVLIALLCRRLFLATDPGAVTGAALLTALALLALLEHWLMVVPLPDAKLWRWMLPAPKQER